MIARVASFLRRYGWLLLFGVGVALSFAAGLLLRGKDRPTAATSLRDLSVELAGIRAEGEFQKRLAGAERSTALVALAKDFEDRKSRLTQTEREAAEGLSHDPVALAGFLARVGARRS